MGRLAQKLGDEGERWALKLHLDKGQWSKVYSATDHEFDQAVHDAWCCNTADEAELEQVVQIWLNQQRLDRTESKIHEYVDLVNEGMQIWEAFETFEQDITLLIVDTTIFEHDLF